MAELVLENGDNLQKTEEISQKMADIGVEVKVWPVANETLGSMLSQETLSDEEKEKVLLAHDNYFEGLKKEAGYQSRDLIVLHKDIENLDQLLDQFNRCHTHDDDEVRYIIDGEGVFGFVGEGGKQMKLRLDPGEYINVPKGTEHWFHLTDKKKIKAIRYFTGKDGWVAKYTETKTRI